MAFYERAVRHAEVLCAPERAEAFEGLSTEAYTEGRAEPALDARRSAIALRRELDDPRAVGANLRWLPRLCWWHGRLGCGASPGDHGRPRGPIRRASAPGRPRF
jgi:hypothetical protein